MNITYDKELFNIWSAKAMRLGTTVGEFTVDGIDFVSEHEVEYANGSYWSTLTVCADGREIYIEEDEIEECDAKEYI